MSQLTSSPRPTNPHHSTLRRETCLERIEQRRASIDDILAIFERILRESVRRERLVCRCNLARGSHVAISVAVVVQKRSYDKRMKTKNSVTD